MKKSITPLAMAILTLAFCVPNSAMAQTCGYHFRSGGARVVRQGQIGLPQHDASYISPGTMSKSAQGYAEGGLQANPGLPPVPLGRTIGTAGDNQYTANPIGGTSRLTVDAYGRIMDTGPVTGTLMNYSGSRYGTIPYEKLGANIGAVPGQPLHPYVPGQNGQQGNFMIQQGPTLHPYIPGSAPGTWSYGEQGSGAWSYGNQDYTKDAGHRHY